jgi:sulfur-carrier protein
MKLTVKLFAFFRDNRFVAEVKEYPEQTRVADIIADLGIDEQEVGVTMLNSRHCRLDARPRENDILAIFPVIGGG